MLYFATVSKGLENFTVELLQKDNDFFEVFTSCPGRVIFSTELERSKVTKKLKTAERFGIILFRQKYEEFYICEDWRKARISHVAERALARMDMNEIRKVFEKIEGRTFRISAKYSISRFGAKGVDINRLSRQIAIGLQSRLPGLKAKPRSADLEIFTHFGFLELLFGVILGSSSCRSYLTHFGTRSTLAYVLSVLANIEDATLIFDPFCGTSAILAECALLRKSICIGADCSSHQLKKSIDNRNGLGERNSELIELIKVGEIVDIVFPIKDNSVDCIVSDVPHGGRYGPKTRDILLLFYQSFLEESWRVLVPEKGRIVLLLSQSIYEIIAEVNTKFVETKKFQVGHGKVSSWICVFMKDSF